MQTKVGTIRKEKEQHESPKQQQKKATRRTKENDCKENKESSKRTKRKGNGRSKEKQKKNQWEQTSKEYKKCVWSFRLVSSRSFSALLVIQTQDIEGEKSEEAETETGWEIKEWSCYDTARSLSLPLVFATFQFLSMWIHNWTRMLNVSVLRG